MVPVVLGALGVGLVGYLAYEELNKKPATKPSGKPEPKPLPIPAPPTVKPQVPPIQNQDGNPRLDIRPPPIDAPVPKAIPLGTTPGGNPIVVIAPINPDNGQPTVASQVAQSSPAVPAAQALYDALKAFGTNPPDKLGLTTLTKAFQAAHNSDAKSVAVGGTLDVDGIYGHKTAAALTVYTGHPIPPEPSIPLAPAKKGEAGPAAQSASNLYAYLKTNNLSGKTKTDKSQTLKTLVLTFQKAVNIDPDYPGPASRMDPKFRIIKVKLVEDGIYGPKTSDALAVSSLERINP